MAEIQPPKGFKKDLDTNARGIPIAPFIDRVEDYVSSRAEAESRLKDFQEMVSKYQFMEANTQRRLAGLQEKVPDIEKTLEMVKFLQLRPADSDPMEAFFELNDTLYAKAEIPATIESVNLWLGANVMLSYPLPEARDLLESKLSGAKTKIAESEEDLGFLREQITTLEVATARVYNWEIGQRRKEKAEAEAEGKQKNTSSEPNAPE